MASLITITFKNGSKQDYELQGEAKIFNSSAELKTFVPEQYPSRYVLSVLSMDKNGRGSNVVGQTLFQYAGIRGGVQLINPDNGSVDSKVIPLADFLGDAAPFQGGNNVSMQKVVEYTAPAVDPITAAITEADGYAAQLVKLGKLTDAQYLADKRAAQGSGWTEATAKAFRDKLKGQVDAAKASEATKAPIGLIIGGVLLAAFLLFRKK